MKKAPMKKAPMSNLEKRLIADPMTDYEIETLRKGRGRQIVMSVKSVSRSGMCRKMSFYVVVNNEFRQLNPIIRKLVDYKQDKNHDLIVIGCGMDMIFSVLSNLNYAIKAYAKLTKAGRKFVGKDKTKRTYDDYWCDANRYHQI